MEPCDKCYLNEGGPLSPNCCHQYKKENIMKYTKEQKEAIKQYLNTKLDEFKTAHEYHKTKDFTEGRTLQGKHTVHFAAVISELEYMITDPNLK